MPIDTTIPGDRSLDGGAVRAPFPNGMLLRTLEFWPDPDLETLRKQVADVNEMVGHEKEITEAERQRHPTMPSRTGPGTTPMASAEPPNGTSHFTHAPSCRTQPYVASRTTSGFGPALSISNPNATRSSTARSAASQTSCFPARLDDAANSSSSSRSTFCAAGVNGQVEVLTGGREKSPPPGG